MSKGKMGKTQSGMKPAKGVKKGYKGKDFGDTATHKGKLPMGGGDGGGYFT